jgi:ATP-dependent helicase HrpB
VDLPELPVSEVFDAVREALAGAGRAVVVAPPGAGKTTLIPLALLAEPWLGQAKIVVLEPRRLATRAAARRMAELLGEQVGATVGYQTRDERVIGPTTRIEVVTEGILTRRLQHDPELPGTGLVIFDEVHERNLATDLGLALALDVTESLRPDLRLLAMSATPDVKALLGVLDGAPVIESAGRMYPVDIRWVPTAPKPGARHAPRIDEAVAATVRRAVAEEPGDVLVFLPGIGEIRRLEAALTGSLGPDIDVLPLAGALTLAEQDAALAPSHPGRRRIVLSTDIAETSLTVAGVRVVIDSGLARAPRFDVRTGMSRLTTITTSRASAEQRAGRAGRLEPGVCYRMWSTIEHGSREAHRRPEIEEVDLAGLALELAAWGSSPDQLRFVTAPPSKTFRAGREMLIELGALDRDGALSDTGRSMLGCAIAAVLDERDVLRGRPDELPCDLALRIELIAGRNRHPLADGRAVARLRDRAADIARRLRIRFDPDQIDADRAGAVLLHAFPDRLAARRRPGQFQLRSGSGAWLPETDPLAHEPFVVAVELDGKRDRARIRLAGGLDGADVARVLADEVAETSRLDWDPERDDLVVRVERRLGAMRLDEQTRPARPGPETTQALLARASATGLAALGWSRASISLRQRVEFLHRALGEPWPDWSIETLTRTLDEWLGPYLAGATGRAQLERVDLVTVLRAGLAWPLGADVDVLAPTELALPSGRRVAIDYSGEAPAVSVRVQDVFGVTEHPTAGGRPIVLHLLSPADRPLQITSDLPGFWNGSWSSVRSELAGRYPKHQWPVALDPLVTIVHAAGPTSRFVATAPRRLADARDGTGIQRIDGQTVRVIVPGQCGVPSDATSVALTVTADSSLWGGAGFVAIWPDGQAMPTSSIVNYRGGQVRANGTIVAIGVGGAIVLHASNGAPVIADVTGWFVPAGSSAGGRFVPVTPIRAIDSRLAPLSRPLAPNETVTVPLPPGIPLDAAAVALTITLTESTGPGFFTVAPGGSTRPLASVLNADGRNQTRAAGSIVGVSPAGIDVYSSSGGHVIVDVTGWFTGGSAPVDDDGLFVAEAAPRRLVDTRYGDPMWAAGTIELANVAPDAAALVVNVAIVNPWVPGYLTAHAARQPRPPTSTVNGVSTSEVAASMAIVPASTAGINIYSNGATDTVVDLAGWFTGTPAAAPGPPPTNVRPPDCTWSGDADALNSYFSTGPAFMGADYQRPFALPDGRVLWLFQDAFVRGRFGQATMVHNAGLVQTGACFTVLQTGNYANPGDYLFADQTQHQKHWFWPLAGDMGTDGQFHLFVAEMRENGPGYLTQTEPIATWIVTIDLTTMQITDRRPAVNASNALYGFSVTSSDNYTYLYAHCHRQFGWDAFPFVSPPVYVHDWDCADEMKVARVPKGQFDQPLAYWNGSTWGASASAAVNIAPGGRMVSASQIYRIDGRWIAVTKVNDWWGEEIKIDVASQPQGPFTTVRTISVPNPCSSCNTYFASLLPYRAANGAWLIGLSHNKFGDFDLSHYHPTFMAISPV